MTMITIIAAMSDNRVIGRGNNLPWHIQGDLSFFKKYTTGKPLIMGRKTFESLKKFNSCPLPNRHNLVITKDKNYQFEHKDVSIHHSLEDAIEYAKSLNLGDEICIGGGAMIYELALPITDKILLTEIHTIIDNGDSFFPQLPKNEWQETRRKFCKAQKSDSANYSFTCLERIK